MVKEPENPQSPTTSKQTHLCLKCAGHTDHTLSPSATGAVLVCDQCKNPSLTYTKQDMQRLVQKALEGYIKSQPDIPDITVPDGTRVFVEYHGDGATEKEIDAHAITAHVKLVGALPTPGKPMFTKGPALHGKHMPIPYGNVVRVESPATSKEP
jgi:hypothetical protein